MRCLIYESNSKPQMIRPSDPERFPTKIGLRIHYDPLRRANRTGAYDLVLELVPVDASCERVAAAHIYGGMAANTWQYLLQEACVTNAEGSPLFRWVARVRCPYISPSAASSVLVE